MSKFSQDKGKTVFDNQLSIVSKRHLQVLKKLQLGEISTLFFNNMNSLMSIYKFKAQKNEILHLSITQNSLLSHKMLKKMD